MIIRFQMGIVGDSKGFVCFDFFFFLDFILVKDTANLMTGIPVSFYGRLSQANTLCSFILSQLVVNTTQHSPLPVPTINILILSEALVGVKAFHLHPHYSML